MKKGAYLFFVITLSVLLAGCVTAKKVIRERVDQNLAGNQGYLQGEGKAPVGRATTREYIDIKVELPTWSEVEERLPKQKKKAQRKPATDKSSSGNQGYFTGSNEFGQELPVKEYEPAASEDLEAVEPIGRDVITWKQEVSIEPDTPLSYQEYTVKEGDTLSHISKKFYDKASKWTVIYEANSDRIKNPSSLKPGTVLLIPNLETIESEYIK